MLATAVALDQICYPVFASPKLDGIRCLLTDDGAVSRTLKPIPNDFVRDILSVRGWKGMDGELIVGPRTAENVYNVTSSGIMSRAGEPDFVYWVFDLWDLTDPYEHRRNVLIEYMDTPFVKVLPHMAITTKNQLLDYEEIQLAEGYEGIMIRQPDSPYKFGRSTVREGYLLKRKPLADAEGEIVDFEYLHHNTNEPTINALGHTERSTHNANRLVDFDYIGTITVRVLNGEFEGVEVSIGTGFTAQDRQHLAGMAQHAELVGRTVKFTYQSEGAKDRPRFPSFKGFRDKEDM